MFLATIRYSQKHTDKKDQALRENGEKDKWEKRERQREGEVDLVCLVKILLFREKLFHFYFFCSSCIFPFYEMQYPFIQDPYVTVS